jgi:hypothetical protein
MWKTIKNILQKDSGKCIIIENEKPMYVVMKMKDYENLLEKDNPSENTEIEKVNQDIAGLRNQNENNLEEIVPEEEVSVEDLPF